MKRIWFVSHYSMPPKYEMRIKTQMYSHHLNQMGYETKIFSASTIHNTNINLISNKKPYICCNYDGLDFVHIKCHDYSGNGLKRIINMLEFSIKFNTVANKFDLPEVVVADVNCINYEYIYKFCKRHNIKFYIDVRDLWPMSIVEYLGYSENNPVIKYLYLREKKMYESADGIIFSMEGGKDYIIEKGWNKENGGPIDLSKVHHINNGVDLEMFDYNKEHYTLNDKELINETNFKVVYAGSIRKANNLELIINAAKYVKEKSENNIKFLIYGDGNEKEYLESKCQKENITNVYFKGKVDKKFIPYIVSKSDLNILNYSYHKIWRFGGSQNKNFEYLAAGKPILSTITMGYDIIEKYSAGISLSEQTKESIGNSIINVSKMSDDEYKLMSNNARHAAQKYDYKVLTKKLISLIEDL